jgi:hypothetical protein
MDPLMCNAIKWSFVGAYLLLLAMSTWGLPSDERTLFSGLLQLMGLPWTLFLDRPGEASSLIGVSPPVLTMLAPAINLAILFSICSALRRRRTLPNG